MFSVTVGELGEWLQALCVGADRRVRPGTSLHGRVMNVPISDFVDIYACAVDVSRVCRGRRMVREIR